MDESADDGAKRELYEETGLNTAYIRQFHTFSSPERDPRERVITIAYYALVNIEKVKGGDDATKAEWFPVDSIPPLAFDHKEIFNEALRVLQKQIYFEPIGFELLPEKFTMTQLQHLYEAILNFKFDRRNFYSKMRKLELLTELEERVSLKNKVEAYLYMFNKEKYDELKEKGFKLEF